MFNKLAEIAEDSARGGLFLFTGNASQLISFGGYAETTLMKKLMEWKPKIQIKDGIKRYYNWVSHNKNVIPQ